MKTRRERVKEATIQEIKLTAWEQISQKGVAGVSINGIARHMGMTAPAFYRYYDSRNALLRELISDSLILFCSELKNARDRTLEGNLPERIFQVYKAWREWAVSNPDAFRLFTELDTWREDSFHKAVNRSHEEVYAIFSELFLQAWESGILKIPKDLHNIPTEYADQLERLKRERDVSAPLEVIHMVLHFWGLVHGLISLEIKGRFFNILTAPAQLFEYQLLVELKKIGLVPRG